MVANDELGIWQTRLTTHFSDLHCRRIDENPDRSIFALEHGLSTSEVYLLSTAVRASIVTKEPSWDHYLPWVVYAAEVGYRYSGDEYWQTFEEETPGWSTNGDRQWIRKCFQLFQKNFGGAVPCGAWAEHFCIICWPIVHAILPLDLQRHLARILYELRHSFSMELFESPAMLGEIIAAHSWTATSRFQKLAQETQLIGQIAAALLIENESETNNLIHPATLKRISEDLARERRSRDWLLGARRSAQERTQVRGLMFGPGTIPVINNPEQARTHVEALGIEPRLVLVPTDISSSSWAVSLEIPNLSHLLVRFPQTREILTGSCCKVAGASRGPLARGRCLYGTQQIRLTRWPLPDEVLIQFEQKNSLLEYLLRTECLLRPGPIRIFRIATDGLAYECRGLRVRPNEKYILVRDDGSDLANNEYLREINLACEGIRGGILTVPSAINKELEEALKKLGLEEAKSLEVWPAGLSPIVWDGEGHGEWLASEQPCLAICTNHPIEALVVSIGFDNEESLEITPITPGEPVFVELTKLPVGLHTVRISARHGCDGATETLGDLNVTMRIRESRQWLPGMNYQAPLFLQMDPAKPTFEQLWEGRVELTINGPADRSVECTISFYENEGDIPIIRERLPTISVPLASDAWRNYFEKNKSVQARASYDTARFCELDFRAEELGGFPIRFEREFAPLRWALVQEGQSQRVRLLNDSGKSVKIAHYSFESPSKENSLEPVSEFQPRDTGGLYSAELEDFTTAIIVPPNPHALSKSSRTPQIYGEYASEESIIRNLSLARLWGGAKLPGDQVSTLRLQIVLQAFAHHIMRLICGATWASAEAELLESKNWVAHLNQLKRTISRQPIGEALEREISILANSNRAYRIKRMTQLAKYFIIVPVVPFRQTFEERWDNSQRILGPEWMVELALRIASNPAVVEDWAGEHLRTGLTGLKNMPTLARASRYLIIVTDRLLLSRPAHGELYSSWGWT